MRLKYKLPSFLIVLVLLDVGCATTGTGPRQLAWDTLPFPKNSDWPGPKGSPASLEGNELILQGRPVRTQQTYSAPLVVDCEFELEARVAPDGFFGIGFVPVGEPPENGPLHIRWLQVAYRNSEPEGRADVFSFLGRDGMLRDGLLWGETPLPIQAGKVYSVRLEVQENHVRLVIDDHDYDLSAVTVPYKEFHIYLFGWQPTNRWHVKEFSIH
jgi:hypothetical protein